MMQHLPAPQSVSADTAALQNRAWLCRPVVWLRLMVGLYAAFFLALTLTAHAAFETSVLDLGIYDQVIWNTAHGRPLAYSAEPWYGEVFLATHLQPILILLALIYWVWSDARALIILQTLAVAASALPVYTLAAWRLRRPWAALALTFAYLMFPALQAINRFVFHPESFEPLLLIGAFAVYELWRGRARGAWLAPRRAAFLFGAALLLALATKEDVALPVFALGAYLWLARRERKLGPAIMVAAALWFAAGMFLVLPHFRGGQGSPFLAYYAHLGATPAEIARTLLTQPQVILKALLTPANADMLWSLLIPLGGLALLAPEILLIAAPTLLAYGLSSNVFMQRMDQFQYAAPVIPWVTLAAIYGLGRWYDRERLRSARLTVWLPVAVLLIASLAYHNARGFTPLSRLFHWPAVTEHQRIGRALMRQIPPDASLVAQDRLYPHLSQRRAIAFVWPSEPSAEYIFLDVSDPTLHNGDGLSEWLRDQVTMEQAAYGVIASQDGFLLLQRGAPPQALAEAFYSFATVTAPAIQHRLSADTAEGIRFLGYDVVTERYANTQIVLYFTATRPPAQDYFIGLHLLDATGTTIGETRFQQPTLVWYPTSRWRPGEIVRVVANTLAWAEEPSHFGLGLVVKEAKSSSVQPGARLNWLPVAGDSLPRDLAKGTVLWLGDFHSQQ